MKADYTDLCDFAQRFPGTTTREEFLRHINAIAPLDKLRNLTEEEASTFFGITLWLNEYAMLMLEKYELERGCFDIALHCLPGSLGSWIGTVLVRDGGPDFSQLDTFGVWPEETREVAN